MAINIDLARALSPLLSLRGGAETSQQQTTTAPADGTVEGLLGGLSSQAPMTQQEQMRRQIGGMFGVDTRSPAEKLTEQIAQKGLGNSSEDLKIMAKMARDLGMDAQAVALATQAGLVKQQEEDRSLRMKRDQQIIDLAVKADERADTTEERELAQEARANATLAINQAARLREISQSEARKTAAQDAFVKEFPDDVELAQAVGAGALTLDEARLWKQKGDPADWPQFLKWTVDNPKKGYGEFLQFKADLAKTTTTPQGTTLDKAEREELSDYINGQLDSGWFDGGARDLPEGVDIGVIKNKVQKVMEANKTIDMETGLALVLQQYGIGEGVTPDPNDDEELSNVSTVRSGTAPPPSSNTEKQTLRPARNTAASRNPRTPTNTTPIIPVGTSERRSGRGFPYRN